MTTYSGDHSFPYVCHRMMTSQSYSQIMKLDIFVDSTDAELYEKYKDAVRHHNNHLVSQDCYDAGFDLFTLTENKHRESQALLVNRNLGTVTLDFRVTCKASMVHDNGKEHPTAFLLVPRSSLTKTPYRFTNSVGIIDSSYRGNVKAIIEMNPVEAHDAQVVWRIENQEGCERKESTSVEVTGRMEIPSRTCPLEKYCRLFQLCSPTLCPIFITLVSTKEQLGMTKRGDGGFGSTGV